MRLNSWKEKLNSNTARVVNLQNQQPKQFRSNLFLIIEQFQQFDDGHLSYGLLDQTQLRQDLPDWLPPAICLISFENPGAPNWQLRSCKVLGSFLSNSRSRKNSNVVFLANSYSMVSIIVVPQVYFFHLSKFQFFLHPKSATAGE